MPDMAEGPCAGHGAHLRAQQILTAAETQLQAGPQRDETSFTLPPPSCATRPGTSSGPVPHWASPAPEPSLDVSQPPSALRPEWNATAVLVGDSITGIEPGDTAAALYGGRSTSGPPRWSAISATLDGDELAIASDLNPQVSYGADVISRIEHAINDEKGCARCTRSVQQAEQMAGSCARRRDRRTSVYAVSVAATV